MHGRAGGNLETFLAGKNVCASKTLTSSMPTATDTSKSDKKAVEQSESKTMQSFVSRTDCLAAEVRWTLKDVTAHYSFNSFI